MNFIFKGVIMEIITYDEFLQMLESDKITPYNIYNIDQDYQQYYSIKHYLEHPSDNFDKDQKLHILFQDIEVYTGNSDEFPKPPTAKYPISAVTIYSSFEKIFRSFILLQHVNVHKFPAKEALADLEQRFKEELVNDGYIEETDNIKITIAATELDLIKQVWNKIKELDPVVLSGWSSENFDLPYTYFRLSNILNKNEKEVCKILSQFETVKVQRMGDNYLIQIPEYPVSDLLYLYKPRDDGGLNYGDKQSNYTLDFVAEVELGLKKKEYKSEGMSLDTFYETDPVNFLLYNIIDVALVKALNKKLRHIESHNLLRRLMKTCFSKSLTGSSALFDTYVNYKLAEEGKYVRFGIIDELNTSISEDELASVYVPKVMSKTVRSIDQNTFRSITGRYPGAYVKQPKAGVITSKEGIIIDLDASSLYPSMIIQSNISFDTFYGRIIDPVCYNFITIINRLLKQKQPISSQVYINLHEFIVKYVETKISPQNKSEYIQNCYLVMGYLLKKIERYKKPLEELFQPKNMDDYIVLKRYFLPLIDLFDDIHPNSKEYNSFCNDYLLNGEISNQPPFLYVIEDILQPTIRIITIKSSEIENYLKTNQLSLTLSGCLFTKHENREGLFIEFLKNLKNLRNAYEKKRDSFDEDSEQYNFYDMRQKAIKITSNTTYGLFGQSTYRFSNKHLAKAITVQGRLTLKIAQIIGEMYLNQYT